MALFAGRTDSPNAPGWQPRSGPRQTLSSDNDKTVKYRAVNTHVEAKAKLRKINNADESGTLLTSSPTRSAGAARPTQTGLVVLVLHWSWVKSVVFAEQTHHCLSGGPRARVSSAETTLAAMTAVGCAGISAGTRAQARHERERPRIGRPLATPASNEP